MIQRWQRSLRAPLLLLLLPVLGFSCGSGDGEDFPRVQSLGKGEIFANILNSSLTIGDNRMLLQIQDKNDNLFFDATAHLRFFDLNGAKPQVRSHADARFVGIETGYVDEQSGGTREVTGEDGVYVAAASFDRAGEWGAKISVTSSGHTLDEIPFRFTVRPRSDEPMVGEAAPASVQATLSTVADITEIDSSSPPRPAMHDTTIAAAVMSGKPTVIAFATPAFCRSRLCAPVMDTVMDPLFAKYGGRAAFIHVEPYALRDLRAGFAQHAAPATLEWRLQSEPWIFVVDTRGRIAAKFEGIVGPDEVEAALLQALSG